MEQFFRSLCIILVLFILASSASSTSETRFFRGETVTVNGENGYLWNTTLSDTGKQVFRGEESQGLNSTWGLRVWNQSDEGDNEITPGSMVAEVFRDSNTCGDSATCSGSQSGRWEVPETNISIGDSLVLRIYTDIGGTVYNTANFTSRDFETPLTLQGTWNATYETWYDSSASGTNSSFRWGNITWNSTVASFNYTRLGHVNASIRNSSGDITEGFNISLRGSGGDMISWESLGQANPSLEATTVNRADHSVSFHGPVFDSFFDADTEQLNVTDAVTVEPQIIDNYTDSVPPSVGEVKTVYAFNDTGMDYSEVNLTFPKLGMNPEAVLHCNDWNFSHGNCTEGGWQVNGTSEYGVEENSTHLWFQTDRFDAVAPAETAFLDVELEDPPSPFSVGENTTFLMNATATCREGDCGKVNGTSRYNETGTEPGTQISDFSGEPLHTVDVDSNLTCAPYLHQGESCNVTWKINATGDLGSVWNVDVNFSTNSSVRWNDTTDSQVKIVTGAVDIEMGWNGISFGEVSVGNTYAAEKNSQRFYNITVTSDSVTSDLWLRGEDLENGTSTIGVTNMTWNASENSEKEAEKLTGSFSSLRRGVSPGKNVTTYYWLSVPYVYAGDYNGTLEVKANASS